MTHLMRAFAAILLLNALLVQSRAEEIARLLDKPFNEEADTRKRVDGSDILGLVAISKNGLKNAESLFVWLPPKLQQNIVCVQVARRDGAYVASNSFELPNITAGTLIRIPIDTAYPEFYRTATEKNFGTIARSGKCPAENGDLLILTWGNLPANDKKNELALMVQSADREVYVSVGEDPQSIRSKCEPIQEGLSIVFDTICKIPAPSWNHVRTQVRIERCAYSQCLKVPPSWVAR